jgi:hypothetical protein
LQPTAAQYLAHLYVPIHYVRKQRDFLGKISLLLTRLIEGQVFDESMRVHKREDFFEKIFPFQNAKARNITSSKEAIARLNCLPVHNSIYKRICQW